MLPVKSTFKYAVLMVFGLISGVSCAPAAVEPLSTTAAITPIATKESLPPTTPPTIPPLEPTELSGSEGQIISVPRGNEVTIDGVLSPGEWEPAYQAELAGGGDLLLMYGDGYLYLGVRAKPEPVTSVCVDQGDQVSILHSSAALGTATYQQGDQGWEKIRAFDWCCRETSDGPQAQASQSEQLRRDDWVANNGRMGTAEEVEYKIFIPNGSLRLGVTSIGAPDYEDMAWWPSDMDDDCRSLRMIQGEIPDRAQFSVENWMTLISPTD
jgi:hypothetical protein